MMFTKTNPLKDKIFLENNGFKWMFKDYSINSQLRFKYILDL